MYKLNINGKIYEATEDKKLMRFLRDDCRLTSVKDGCAEGACGACTVLIDGKPTRACIPLLSKLEGKEILTVDGLSDREKEAFVYAFGKAGAVQCGFCIPGMVISAKALIDKNPSPTREEVANAIRNNICRCTGYKKIIDGIESAAAILRGDEKIEEQSKDVAVGSKMHRIDVHDKVLGIGIYPDDIYIDGMVYGSAVRSAYPRAKVLKIDVSEAEAMEGVLGVLTVKDLPNRKVGHIIQDWDVFIGEGEYTRYMGDALCLVVAESMEVLAEAKKAVKVEYEKAEPVRTPLEAIAEGAPLIHEKGNICAEKHVARGDAEAAIKNSKYVVSEDFNTPFTEHAFLEPECAVAFPYKDGVKVITTDQGVYDTRKEISIMMGWDPDRIVVENALVGGGFGGKEDVSVQHLAVLAANVFKKPVKCKMDRQESINFHPKRHAMQGNFTLGCDENGIFQGMMAKIYFDTGAYASLCGPVLERACTHAVGPYAYQNTKIDGLGMYTNNVPAGAFRGFGVCQSCFALESLINKLADKVGISPWEIRYRNAIKPGGVLPNGQIADASTALIETLEAVKDIYEAHKDRAGLACAMKNAGVGVGLPDKGRCRLLVRDGIVEIYSAASDIGQGISSVLVQIACETLKVKEDKVKWMGVSSELAPDSGTTSGSRQTLITGEACRMACSYLLEDMADASMESLEGKEYFAEYFEPTDPITSTKPNPKSHVAYGYATQLVIVDDDGKLTDVYAAHAVGKAVNPPSLEGQIEGGVVMGLGYALTEDFPLVDCVPKVKYGTLGLFRANMIPEIHSIIIEKPGVKAAYGAIGVGEIVTIPTAPAVQGAYYALDKKFRTCLPLKDTAYSKNKN